MSRINGFLCLIWAKIDGRIQNIIGENGPRHSLELSHYIN
jgi:hypothetical protein